MKISLVSDLHLEFSDLELPGGEVLILAGDVCEVKNIQPTAYDPNGIMFDFEQRDRRPDRYIRFFLEECSKYRKVFYVMGNHEHYHGRFDRTLETLKGLVPANVTVLENELVEYCGINFLGATLWTDCNRGDPITLMTLKDSMNDYRVVTNHYKDGGLYYKLTPKATRSVHRATLSYFEQTLKTIDKGPVVVITHHAPSFASVPPKFKSETHLNGGYASDLSEFILNNPNIKYWVHGHMHDPVDYMIGDTRILANPRGYYPYEGSADYQPLTFDIDD